MPCSQIIQQLLIAKRERLITTDNAGDLDMHSMTSTVQATQEDLESVGWDYLFTADTHHSTVHGDISPEHHPLKSYSKFNVNEVQDKNCWKRGLAQERRKKKCAQNIVHNNPAWKMSTEGVSHTNFDNGCHSGWLTPNEASIPCDMTSTLLPPPHWMLSEHTPPQDLSISFFTSHTEEIKHENLDVGELVGKVIEDVNTNTDLNHQPFSSSTDEVSSDRCEEAEYYAAASNMELYAEYASLPLKASTDSSLKYQGFTSANDANCQKEDRQNVEQVLRHDMELDKCSQNWWNKQTEVQTGFKDQQHMLEIDEPIRAPYSYSNIKKGLVGNEDESANGEDKFGKYAKTITQSGRLNDDERNVDMATEDEKKTDRVDKDKDTNN